MMKKLREMSQEEIRVKLGELKPNADEFTIETVSKIASLTDGLIEISSDEALEMLMIAVLANFVQPTTLEGAKEMQLRIANMVLGMPIGVIYAMKEEGHFDQG